MFCDKCGAAVQAGQRFCSRCGKEFAGATISFPQRGRVAGHVRLVGILWLALSALNAIGALFLFAISNVIFLHIRDFSDRPNIPAGFIHVVLAVVGIVLLVKAAAGFLAGWGLLQRQSWARLLTIVLSFLALFNVPFGTALGIYSLWVLLPAASDAEYEQHVRSVGAA